MTLTQPRKAPLSRRWKYRDPPRPTAPIQPAPVRTADEALTPVDQMRVDKWIRDRLIDWRDSCWQCRKPIVVGQVRTVVSNGEVAARLHQHCHSERLAQQEVAARRAMGLDRSERK
jgi:hypothetical protein